MSTFYSIHRLHLWMAISSLALLAATVWMFVAEQRRPAAIEQVYLPELTVDYHFAEVPRVDRCITCHQGMDDAAGDADSADPLHRPHPRLELFVGADSPHPLAEFGCTICHEGQGTATDFHWASHAPNDPKQAADWRQRYGWSANPHWDLPMLPRRFAEVRCLKCHQSPSELEPSRRFSDPPAAKLVAGYHLVRQLGCFGCHEMTPALAERRVGPSLRDIADKVDARYLLDRLADPARFLPGTRMPRLFGLVDHLDGETAAETKQHEAAEMAAIVDYLLAASRPVDDSEPGRVGNHSEPGRVGPGLSGRHAPARNSASASLQESPSAERGKRLFELRACLACHQHADFPGSQAVQGPDLSTMGAKYNGQSGARWLTGWLRDPSRYSPQTSMPNLRLSERAAGPLSPDPAADIAAYLLQGTVPIFAEGTAPIFAPAKMGLSPSPRGAADPAALGGRDTRAPDVNDDGRRAIARRGCAGCHDIAGFDRPQPIGPALGDWGRKPESQLAFGNVERFVDSTTGPRDDAAGRRATIPVVPGSGPVADRPYDKTSGNAFYGDAIRAHRREGFAWQKLLAPRSFDYETARGKPYEEQLRMGRFNLSDEQREAVVAFLLALVADPPAERYVYRPGPRRKALVEGRQVLDKYACAECHTLEMERWRFAGAELVGMPRIDAHGRLQEDEDADGKPAWFFTLWEPAEIEGRKYPVGGADAIVPKDRLAAKQAPRGGALARRLYPAALREARAAGAAAVEVEAWGWLPPALAYEGEAVRPEWLREYLLRPRTIRPAALLHMPQFNMLPDEAGKLVDYFAAVAGETDGGRKKGDSPIFAGAKIGTVPFNVVPFNAADDMPRFDNALKLVLDRTTFCAKCHLVGDFSPGGLWTALAPNLDESGRRLRPEHVRRWLADPRSVLPYTAMPPQFPSAGPPLGQNLFPATSREQLDAVADLLLHYDWYWQQRNSVRQMMENEGAGFRREGSGFGVQGSGRE